MARPETGNIPLAEGAERKVFTGPANYLYCYDQTGLVEVDLLNGNELVETHMVERLLSLRRKNFDTIIIRNRHSGTNVVRFFFGKGDSIPNADRSVVVLDDAIPPVVDLAPGASLELTGSTINLTVDVASVVAPRDDVTVTSSATLLAAANSDRLEITISIKDTAANGIRLGNAGVTATKGVYIGPGQSYTVSNRGALYAIRDGGTDVSVSILENEKV